MLFELKALEVYS